MYLIKRKPKWTTADGLLYTQIYAFNVGMKLKPCMNGQAKIWQNSNLTWIQYKPEKKKIRCHLHQSPYWLSQIANPKYSKYEYNAKSNKSSPYNLLDKLIK